jgi:Uma2 family endonuclease
VQPGEPNNRTHPAPSPVARTIVDSDEPDATPPAEGQSTTLPWSIICRPFEPDPEDPNTAVNPVVIVEVLSDSTEAYDRGEKFAHYRRIPSLRDYLLVVQREARLEHYRRNEDDTWTLREVRAPGAVRLSIGCELSVEDVYLDPMAEPA